MEPRVYLDHNATTPLKSCVMEAMLALPPLPYNPSSIHSYGREARRIVEEARRQIKRALKLEGHDGYECVFTASGTEANNLALKGLNTQTLLVSAIEHASVLKIEHGNRKVIPVTSEGIVDLAALETLLAEAEGKILVSVMLANNETGILQPIREIAELAQRYDALVHCDAVQAFGKIDVAPVDLNVDLLTISAHKCGGPLGAGALIYKKKYPLSAIITGGGQERSLRSGTENVPAIVGFGAAAANLAYDAAGISALRDGLETSLEGARMIGKRMPRLPNTSYLVMPGVASETQLIDFDLKGVAVSAGSACSSGKVTVSHVLLAMGVPEKEAACAVRVSLGEGTSENDITRFIAVWKELYARSNKVAA